MLRMRCALLLVSLAAFPVRAVEVVPAGWYDVTTETRMPHLEESLRYATTRAERCIRQADLSSAFPILAHDSLAGCTFANEVREENAISYALVCTGGRGTTGRATWSIGDRSLHGMLNVKLGGKNMTFYQRIIARRTGECPNQP